MVGTGTFSVNSRARLSATPSTTIEKAPAAAIAAPSSAEAEDLAERVELEIAGQPAMVVARGNGPVDALDAALRRALEPVYPALDGVRLTDYKVRILTPEDGTRAVTRVMIESKDPDGYRWCTVGVAANVIDASYRALEDSLIYRLRRG